jgi:AbrB family looped-hinge helix DNA binding protein
MELISIDSDGRTILPKAIRDAVGLGSGGVVKVRVMPDGIIQLEPISAEGRQLKKEGKYLVAVNDGGARYDADAEVRAERGLR